MIFFRQMTKFLLSARKLKRQQFQSSNIQIHVLTVEIHTFHITDNFSCWCCILFTFSRFCIFQCFTSFQILCQRFFHSDFDLIWEVFIRSLIYVGGCAKKIIVEFEELEIRTFHILLTFSKTWVFLCFFSFFFRFWFVYKSAQ